MNRFLNACVLVFGLGVGCVALGTRAVALEMPAIFADHMVLQRDTPVPVWGRAEPGRWVEVSFDDQKEHAIADADGYWRVDLQAMSASSESAMLSVVEGPFVDTSGGGPSPHRNVKQFNDILVGDVWHCGGQSNMSWQVSKSDDAAAEIAAADDPLIRLFTSPRVSSDTPQFSSDGQWAVASPATAGNFSAVAYYFGRKIHASQGVPVGLVVTSWGGASAEAYTPLDALNADPATAPEVDRQRALPAEKQKPQQTPAALWNGMIHPVAPFAHRGVLWYQGESNTGRSLAYRTLLPMMIESWRELWDQPAASPAATASARDTPFLIVQLANFQQPAQQPPATDGWGELRDAQAYVAATVPNAYLATAIDLGDANDIHPTNKQEVGRRLARLAEHHVYGDESVVPVGPTMYAIGYDSTEPGVATVRWNHAAGLTTTYGLPPRGFAIRTDAGSPWVWANAEIDSRRSTVRLTHPAGSDGPFEIRYAYGINPSDGPNGINLINAEKLPAMPFRAELPGP